MFQKAAGKAVVHAFCRRMFSEAFDEFRIVHEIILHCFPQVGIRDLLYIAQQFLIHGVRIFICGGHVVRRIELAFARLPDLLDVHLQIVVVADDIAIDFDEVFLVIICDPAGVRVPDLAVQGACFVLQDQVVIGLAVPGLRRTLAFAQINVPNGFSLPEGIDISHKSASFLSISFRLRTKIRPNCPGPVFTPHYSLLPTVTENVMST